MTISSPYPLSGGMSLARVTRPSRDCSSSSSSSTSWRTSAMSFGCARTFAAIRPRSLRLSGARSHREWPAPVPRVPEEDQCAQRAPRVLQHADDQLYGQHLAQSQVNSGRVPYSWKVLLSGHVPEYLYDIGRLDTHCHSPSSRTQPGQCRGPGGRKAADFSSRLRAGLPGTG